MTSCPKCKLKLDEGSKFCGECGAKVVTPVVIPPKKEAIDNKSNSNWWSDFVKNIAVFLGVILILFVAYSWGQNYASSSNSNPSGNILKTENAQGTSSTPKSPVCHDVQTPYETQEAYMKTEYYTETVPYTDRECDTKKLEYSITNFNLVSSKCINQIEECNSYTLGVCTSKTIYCIDRTVVCSLNLNNLDDEQGSWTIDFLFFKQGSSRTNAANTDTRALYPKSTQTITSTGDITIKDAIGTGGIMSTTTSEPIYSCSYQVTQEPTKQVCRDVIKYKDIQKERQVTAYRPVTKYKTVQKCD